MRHFSGLLQAHTWLHCSWLMMAHKSISPGIWKTCGNRVSPQIDSCSWLHRRGWEENRWLFESGEEGRAQSEYWERNPYMCVPISFTSWWITSSMQQSGLSSATVEFDADKLSLWELVCRSACRRSTRARQPWLTLLSGPSVLDRYHKLHLHKNVLYYLAAVVVHADVTGEGFTEEDISGRGCGKEHSGESTLMQQKSNRARISYPKFCGKVSISPSIKFSAPLMVDGSSLMSWLNKSPKGFTQTCASWVTPVLVLSSYSTHSRGDNKETLNIPHKYTQLQIATKINLKYPAALKSLATAKLMDDADT